MGKNSQSLDLKEERKGSWDEEVVSTTTIITIISAYSSRMRSNSRWWSRDRYTNLRIHIIEIFTKNLWIHLRDTGLTIQKIPRYSLEYNRTIRTTHRGIFNSLIWFFSISRTSWIFVNNRICLNLCWYICSPSSWFIFLTRVKASCISCIGESFRILFDVCS